MKKWEIKITMSVADSWVADGFDASQPSRITEITEAIQGMLPHAYGHEVKVDVKITKAPSAESIKNLQDGTVEVKD